MLINEQRPRHPKLDEVWQNHESLIMWWANKLKKWSSKRGHLDDDDRDSIVSYLFLKMNNDLWLWDPKRGVKFSTYFSAHIYSHYVMHYLKFESDYEMVSWTTASSKDKRVFKCRVINESVLLSHRDSNIDSKKSESVKGHVDIVYKDIRDHYNWASDIIQEIGGTEEMWKVLTLNIKKRPLRVLYHRFVLGDTLKQTAEVFGVSRERIRQIEAQALDKIRRRFHINKPLRSMIKEYGLTVKLNY